MCAAEMGGDVGDDMGGDMGGDVGGDVGGEMGSDVRGRMGGDVRGRMAGALGATTAFARLSSSPMRASKSATCARNASFTRCSSRSRAMPSSGFSLWSIDAASHAME